MSDLEKKISAIAENQVAGSQLFIIEINFRGNERNRIIEIFVDGEHNISADDLAGLSRNINEKIEEENLFKGTYRLDVSTPGVDRPLKFFKQYHKHINRKFELQYQSGGDSIKINARLTSVEDDDLIFSHNGKLIKINYNDIINAKVLISFS